MKPFLTIVKSNSLIMVKHDQFKLSKLIERLLALSPSIQIQVNKPAKSKNIKVV